MKKTTKVINLKVLLKNHMCIIDQLIAEENIRRGFILPPTRLDYLIFDIKSFFKRIIRWL